MILTTTTNRNGCDELWPSCDFGTGCDHFTFFIKTELLATIVQYVPASMWRLDETLKKAAVIRNYNAADFDVRKGARKSGFGLL